MAGRKLSHPIESDSNGIGEPDGLVAVNPDDLTGTEPTEPNQPRKRGRKPGSTNAKKKTAQILDSTGIEKILLSVHGMLAGMMSNPIWELDKDEAKKLSEAIVSVQAHYPMAINAKTLAWVNLGMIGMAVYGPRVFYIVKSRQKVTNEITSEQQ